jgi:hypothetical protein
MAVRKRGACVTLMLTVEEREQLRAAAKQADMPLSVFLRLLVMMALKRGETLAVVRTDA